MTLLVQAASIRHAHGGNQIFDASNRTVAKHLVVAHGIFRRAMKVWGLPRNPVADVERPRVRISNDIDALSPEEKERFLPIVVLISFATCFLK